MTDAHNHLQDDRLDPSIVAEFGRIGVKRAVVNGTSERDWEAVLELARRHKWVLPSIGLHPWHVRGRSADWQRRLESIVRAQSCGIGEIGLDRWIENPDCAAQEEVFAFQLSLAAERNLPASIHCLKAWGRLNEILRSSKLPSCGFLLHSYNGPREMLGGFLDLGAHISLSGHFAHERKERQRQTLRAVPLDRILIETDAPDMVLPEERDRFKLRSPSGERVNHPCNLPEIYSFAAALFGTEIETFTATVDANFERLFGPLLD